MSSAEDQAIAQLRGELDQLRAALGAQSSDGALSVVRDLRAQVTANATAIAALQSQQATDQNAIAAMQNQQATDTSAITALRNQQSTDEADIATLQSQVAALNTWAAQTGGP